uniref:Uncharacterized protein n=1 Tax=Kalanchoe fedtschenkoi TaxID=63787 RepID=A0A7N0TX43_KALFE
MEEEEEEQQQQGGQGWLQQQLQRSRQEHQQGQGDHRNHQTMKKIIFYEFMPTKMREDYCKMNNIRPNRKWLKEMRDMDPPPQTDPDNPWRIRKALTAIEVAMKKIIVTEKQAVDHIFRYWSFEMANHAFLGRDAFRELVIWDVTALPVGEPVKVCSASTFFRKAPTSGNYSLGLGDLVERRGLGPLDEVGLYWEPTQSAFFFKLLRRHNNPAATLLLRGSAH